MCGSGGLLGTGLFATPDLPQMPPVVRSDPKADAEKAAAEAAQKATTERIAKRRKSVSLLATGGQGDAVLPAVGQPAAKSQLGQ